MTRRQKLGLIAFFGGLVLLNYPVVNIINDAKLVGGIPQVFLYVFLVWVLIVGVAYFVSTDERGI